MDYAIEVKNLHKSFKKNFWSSSNTVLKGLNFAVPMGSAVGFLGANGSGKTTTFKCLLELIKKEQGEVLFFGSPLCLKTRSRIGFLPERPYFYMELTAEECLLFYSSLNRPLCESSRERIEQGLKVLSLYEWRHKRLKTFSKGMLQKVGILQALVHEPDLLLLDEPFSGLDPESRFLVAELLEQIIQKGCTVFLSSHIFQDIERICDKLLILKQGEVIFEGNFSALQGGDTERKNIVYLLKGKKQSLQVFSQKETQKELKRLLLEGAVILSLQSAGGNLEEKYQKLMKKNPEKKENS